MFLDRFDVVHIASVTRKNLAAVRLAKMRSFGACQFLYTANLQMSPGVNHYDLFRRAVKSADQVISVSKAVESSVASIHLPKAGLTIPNGFDPDFFDPAAAASASENVSGGRYVLWVGVIEDRKRPDLLIDIASSLPDIKFKVAGSPGREQKEDWVGRLKACPNIEYLGSVDRSHLRALLGKAAVFLFTSDFEGLPLSLIEAIGMGVPAVVQDRSSMPEVVSKDSLGFLCDANDLESWRAALKKCLQDDQLNRRRQSGLAREHAIEHYSWSSVARKYQEVYHSLWSKVNYV